VTAPARDPTNAAISPLVPRVWQPRLARDRQAAGESLPSRAQPCSMSRRAPAPMPSPNVAMRDTAAAARARRPDSPAPAGCAVAAKDAPASVADTPRCTPAACPAPTLSPRTARGTPYTAQHSSAASAAVSPGRKPRTAPPSSTGGGSTYVSRPRVNPGERRRDGRLRHSRAAVTLE
jgi:hypothetical protein